MLIRDGIAALRGDDTPQRTAQGALLAAAASWRGRPDVAPVLDALGCYAQGAALAECPALAGLFVAGVADAFARGLVATMTAVLADHPLGHIAMRYFTNGTTTTLLLGQAGDTTLSLVAIDGAGLARTPPPRSVSFTPTQTTEHVLAGTGEMAFYTREPMPDGLPGQVRLMRSMHAVSEGMVVARDGAVQAAQTLRVSGRLVTLRLQRRTPGAGCMQEYDLGSGQLLHRATTSHTDSRRELMATLLGQMGRGDAVPVLADMARGAGVDSLRWQALRACIGLDTAAGFAALVAIANDDADPLTGPAAALRVQLVAAYPQLQELELCPA